MPPGGIAVTYQAITGVWEITMGCNMRCKHCGSSCTQPLPDELTTDEALDLCDQIGALGFQWITLSGGEPLLRSDWEMLVRRLRGHGVIPNIITNGWMCNEEVIERARAAGVGTFAVSLDGLEETHDFIRKPGSFQRTTNALRLMAEKGVHAGVITTVQKRNIDELDGVHRLLLGLGVTNWQVQIGLPMGNFSGNRDMLLGPEAVDVVIDFIHARSTDPRMHIYPADCTGYYSRKDIETRTRAYRASQPVTWQGCNAGKRSLGILHNGDVLGCTSIRDRAFIEGNVRERPLADIWNDPGTFAWSRGIAKSDLGGHCRTCRFGDACLGGCPNTRLTINGTINSGNAYCSYNVALDKAAAELEAVEDIDELRAMAGRLVTAGETQLAGMVLERLLERRPEDVEALSQFGFVSWALGNYDDARVANERVLALDPGNVYATKGLGVVLHAMGRTEDGIDCLRRAVALGEAWDADSCHDLAVVYLQSGRAGEAQQLLTAAAERIPGFRQAHGELYGAAGC
jgi:radical SAM protein with 4Fe4S-binding SPASM domain